MRSKNANITLFILIVVLLFAFFKWRNLEYIRSEPINRNTDSLSYTSQALCWMNCQHITKEEIKNIIQKGIIIFNKSNRFAHPCPIFTLRGFNNKKESLELIIQECGNKTILVDCINLKTKANCSCP